MLNIGVKLADILNHDQLRNKKHLNSDYLKAYIYD